MNNQRPPSDDLQKGEHDLYTAPFQPIRKIDLETGPSSIPANYNVWWVDSEGNDRQTKISAESHSKSIEIVRGFENCKYVVVSEKVGVLKERL